MAPVFSKLLEQDDDKCSGVAGGEHWSAEYRRRLGIGDSPVEFIGGFGHWQPPKRGEIKINFSTSMPEPSLRSRGRSIIKNWGGISAVARDSSGDLLAVSSGRMKVADGDKLGLELYALKAAANLAKKLRDLGKHDGPVIYETGRVLVTCCLQESCEGDPKAVLEASMPEDLEDVAMSCTVVYGDRLRTLPRDFLREVEQDKINAGIEPSIVLSSCLITSGFVVC